MRWEDERYIKLYTRDTPEWLALSWQARGLFLLVLRVLDRDGVLKLGRLGLRGVAVAVRAEADAIEVPLRELLADGCVVFEPQRNVLIVPNFRSAQTASQSDAARQRASRERKKSGGDEGSSPQSHTLSHAVTPSHYRIEENRLEEREENKEEEEMSVVRTVPQPQPSARRSDGHLTDDGKIGNGSQPTLFSLEQTGSRSDNQAMPPASRSPVESQQNAIAADSQTARETGLETPPATPRNSPEAEVFETYVAGWKRTIRGTRPPVFDDKRRKLVKARLRDFSVDDLKRAAQGIWRSSWHVENKQTAFDLVFRDSAHVERFMALAETGRPVATKPRESKPRGDELSQDEIAAGFAAIHDILANNLLKR